MRDDSNWTGVGSSFTARHDDPFMDEGIHEHTWHVIAWYPSTPFRDSRSQKVALRAILDTWEGTLMKPDLWSAEAIGRAILTCLGECVGVDVSRPSEGFYVKVRP